MIQLSITPGMEFVFGVRFEVVALTGPPSSVVDEIGDVPEFDAAGLDAAERGWHWEAGMLAVKLGPGAHELSIEP